MFTAPDLIELSHLSFAETIPLWGMRPIISCATPDDSIYSPTADNTLTDSFGRTNIQGEGDGDLFAINCILFTLLSNKLAVLFRATRQI